MMGVGIALLLGGFSIMLVLALNASHGSDESEQDERGVEIRWRR